MKLVIFFFIALLSVSSNHVFANKLPALSPQEAIKTIEVPEGYHLECVASEPMVQEPTHFVFDGNGAMYVAEWLTYMQDEHATGQSNPVSRIVKLVDTNGDGKMDHRTVFVDNVLLPRAILPLQDRVLVILTGSNSVWSFFDDDNDGVSDRRELSFEGQENTANIEHQSSGLLWNLDNVIYNNHHQFRWKDGKLINQLYHPKKISQWGLARDDEGRIFSSRNGDPCYNFQLPGAYPKLDVHEHEPDYLVPYSICAIEDQSSGGYQFDKKRILNKMSSTCGQTVFRSHLMPEFYGKVTTCENVGRLIRMSEIKWDTGKGIAHNAFPRSEFIRSPDAYFRPTWTETGPDGCFYFSDMYRGIIQEKNWFPTEGDHPWVERYHRIKELGMIDVVRHGRIYRLVPNDKQPGPTPRMREQTSKQLVAHLSHPNGWWRDCAQKLIVSRGDRSAVPALQALLAGNPEVQTTIQALWCLEGLAALTENQVQDALNSPQLRLRRAALQLSEPYLKKGKLLGTVGKMLHEKDPTTAMQLYLSLGQSQNKEAAVMRQAVIDRNPDHSLIMADLKRVRGEADEKSAMKNASVAVKRGRDLYLGFCVTCHGQDGYGKVVDRVWLAPSLRNSTWFKQKDVGSIARVLLKGQTGPVNGRDYAEGMMIPLDTMYNDQQLSDVVNYIGDRFHRWEEPIKPDAIARVRELIKSRNTPWTHEELLGLDKNE